MKFMFFSENETVPGSSYRVRYKETVEQVIHAENWGFDYFGVSEQMLAIGGISTAAPEVLFAYLYPLTSRIRFRHSITLIPKNMNHPLKVASRTAVEDILSNGRIELGVGRGNTMLALRAFEVDLEKSKSEMAEGVQIIKKAFTDDPFMFYGEHYSIPPRSLVPKPIQTPYPPLFMATTSEASSILAGKLGVGILTWSNAMGWDGLAKSVSAFRKETAKTKAKGEHVNEHVATLVLGYCAETDDQAREEAADPTFEYLKVAINAYPRLAKAAKDYAYMSEVIGAAEKLTYDYFVDESASAIFGSPESCIKQIERHREIGIDEVIIRIDSVPHEKVMKSIEMFGRYVIPHFRNSENVVRPTEDIVADIREMREQAKKEGVYKAYEGRKAEV